ncbi:MAG TPA: penicillin-binding protein 2 [Actinomycetota bacterium]
MTEAGIGGRLKVLAGIVVFLFAALVTRLWFLQVLAAEEYKARAETNRVRLVPISGQRGQILDRNGEVLVDNRDSLQVTVNPRLVPNMEALLLQLSDILDVRVEDMAERVNDPTFLPFQPIPVADDVPERLVFYLAEHRREFPGVSYQVVGVRKHSHGTLAAHVLGYLGEINGEELNEPVFDGYQPGDEVGRGGMEQQYERYLRGKDGWQKLEVDSAGRSLGGLGRQEPGRGNDLVLTLDLGIQQIAEESLAQGIQAARGIATETGYLRAPAGAAVVLDPMTGEVLAMASYPTFDPGIFDEEVTDELWGRLQSPSSNYPLNNRAVQGLYPPGSTIKPFIAAAALKAGLAKPGEYFDCPPTFEVPGDTSGTVFHNWKSTSSGHISLQRALTESCDTVFYRFGYQFYKERSFRGEKALQQELRQWGFDVDTGIDLPGELEGRVPDPDWKQAVHDAAPKAYPEPLWLPGDTINMAIGQGDLLVTPLQLAVAYAALANGGTIYRPQLAKQVQSPAGEVLKLFPPSEAGTIRMSPTARRMVIEGLRGAVSVDGGTATGAFAGFGQSLAGKTGTAEVIVDGRDTNHSWFAAFAPVEDPRFLVVTMVEQGGHGSEVAAPIVRHILEYALDLERTEINIAPATD